MADPDDELARLLALRNQRKWAALLEGAESLCRRRPDDATARRLYGQALVESGHTVPALALLEPLAARLPRAHPERAEAAGLIGRVRKQHFLDTPDAPAAWRRDALAQAITAYDAAWRLDPALHTWPGVNLLALVTRARREGWPEIAARWDPAVLAVKLAKALRKLPPDDWTLPTLAEVSLGYALATGELRAVEQTLREYLAAPATTAFHVGSTLRQFEQVWQLDAVSPGAPGVGLRGADDAHQARALLELLRARLLSLPGGDLALPTAQMAAPAPSDVQLEAVLGADGPQTYAWWRAGVEAAASVGVIRQRLGKRLGTGFVVRAGDFGLPGAPDELLLLTNYHVVNPTGDLKALRPADAEVLFEALDGAQPHAVREVLWWSKHTEHDACLLRLATRPEGLRPLVLADELPAIPPPAEPRRPRVYVIGHPGGRELAFSFQDNELLDHEAPPHGTPALAGVWRVHYRAPTEGGHSGSPVFDDRQWKVIALHHGGAKSGVPRLNGGRGSYAANEGLAIMALAAAARAALSARPPAPAG